ncbi:MAG TPA: Rieske (2Fe-2S) protein, partial [Candidatus Limnocylindria bacterium]|nr:Rieske (2Fe-2S) protein [Candidatus Limnocylindria bacterium]
KTLLHGTWPLRHPLHPAFTDWTVGGYTTLFALDVFYLVTRDPTLVRATDFVLVLSLISSLGSIVSGLTDWNETFDEERRNGMLHGLLMVVASIGFVASLWLRVGSGADQRDTAIAIAIVAFAILVVSSYLGGEMVFGYGTDVNRQAWIEAPAKWERLDVAAGGLDDRTPVVGKTKKGMDVFVAKVDGQVYAMGNVCTHAGGPLNEGKWVGKDRCEIQCPWHASVFCVKDAGVRSGPATFSEQRLETRVDDKGFLEVRAAR